jgi:hypothetical protein
MRALALALVAVLALPAATEAQVDWARAYEDGVEAFKKGNDALAEAKLIEARDHKRAPEQSRRANFSSIVYKPFIPDFYLGVIAARNGRYAEAQRLLEGALRRKLITEGDKAEFQMAQSMLTKAHDDQAKAERLASNTTRPPNPVTPDKSPEKPPVTTSPVTPTQPSNQTTPGNTTPSNTTTPPPIKPQQPPANTVTPPPIKPSQPPPNVEPAWQPGFRKSMDAARAALGQNRYAEARSSQAAARSAAGDAASRTAADALGRDIDNAQLQEAQRIVDTVRGAIRRKDAEAAATQIARLETLSPQHAALPGLRKDIEALTAGLQGAAALARVERLGVRLFLSGNYKQAADELAKAVESQVTSPRVYLFLASSRAAQALLASKDQRDALVAEARRTYALARSGGALPNDERYISPSILELLKSS